MQVTSEGEGRSAFRADIQGLRAIAVGIVLLYHVWPNFFPGGYIGVDVFFVISGFLITSLLLRELVSTGTISFSSFYARRARRLLPASLFTLLAVVVAAWLVLPGIFQRDVAADVVAAALYAENWWLDHKALDYLAQGSASSPVQHFWSLSVEEQFYFFWPLLMLAVYHLSGRADNPSRRLAGLNLALGLLVLGSLFYSVAVALAGVPGNGYFSSFTRIWQLGIGGLLALNFGRLRPGNSAMLVASIVVIGASTFLYSGNTVYPGWAALVPTLAAAFAILAGRSYSTSIAARWLGFRPVQYLGDISYSLYLWHWPVIALYKRFHPGEFGLLNGLGIVLVSLVLAAISKKWLEDAFRSGKATSFGSPKVVLSAALASVACATIAAGLYVSVDRGRPVKSAESAQSVDSAHIGALAIGSKDLGDVTENFIPALADVEADVATAYAQGCIQQVESGDVLTCTYGPDDAATKIAVIGDSHAVHWLPAFQELVRKYDLQVIGITKTSCAFSDVEVFHNALKRGYTSCVDWSRQVVTMLKARPDIRHVVVSESSHYYDAQDRTKGVAASAQLIAPGMQRHWDELRASGKEVVAIAPTPWQPVMVRECAALHKPPFAGCTGKPGEVIVESAVSVAARSGGYPLIDMNDRFCFDGRCPAVIGGVFVYRDTNHITATYARTLAPALVERLALPGLVERDGDLVASQLPVVGDISRLKPALEMAKFDRGEAFADKCLQTKGQDVVSCQYGAQGATVHIAVVGDGAAANAVPAINAAAQGQGWRITTYFKDSCLFSTKPVYSKAVDGGFLDCVDWSRNVLGRLEADRPDIVLVAQSPLYRVDKVTSPDRSKDQLAIGVADVWTTLARAGIRIVRMEYTPWMQGDVPLCLASEALRKKGCFGYRQGSVRGGALTAAALLVPEVKTLDITDEFCGPEYCPAVKGDVVLYRDASQPTATFMRSIAPKVSTKLAQLVERVQRN